MKQYNRRQADLYAGGRDALGFRPLENVLGEQKKKMASKERSTETGEKKKTPHDEKISSEVNRANRKKGGR